MPERRDPEEPRRHELDSHGEESVVDARAGASSGTSWRVRFQGRRGDGQRSKLSRSRSDDDRARVLRELGLDGGSNGARPASGEESARPPINAPVRRQQRLLVTRERPEHDRRDSAVVDSAVYLHGERISRGDSLEEAFAEVDHHSDAFAWIGLYRPGRPELERIADEFNLHELAVEDAINAHQRPKIEQYGDTLFIVLKAARYLDDVEEVEFGELHLFVGPNFIITVRHAEKPDLAVIRHEMERDRSLLRMGPHAVAYRILDTLVDAYLPVVDGLSNDIDEIETDVFTSDADVSQRVYELNREVIEFQRACEPLLRVVRSLVDGAGVDEADGELRRYLRDVEDHLTSVVEQTRGFAVLLRDILTVNATLVSQRQNEEMAEMSESNLRQAEDARKIAAWGAIIFAPQLVTGVYGMNFDFMPELHWAFGYPMAIGLMGTVAVGLYFIFRHNKWL